MRTGSLWLVLLAPLVSQAAGYECLIEPSQVVELRTPVEGLIAKINVRRGDAVRRGQVLMELQSDVERVTVESARYRAQMEGQIGSAKNRIEYAKRKLARTEELLRENMVSMQARDEADTELRLAQSELQVALEARELARIEQKRAIELLAMRALNSPFDGVVVDRMLNPGDLAESGTGRKPVLKIAQIDPLNVDIVLPGVLFGKVRAGTVAVIRPMGSDQQYVAKVDIVDRVIDAASGTFVARVALSNRDGSIASGMRCQAEFDTQAGAVKPVAQRK